ncbi:S-methyl-5'-thioinosine phosphorylase [compost metagenome]
MVGMTGMPEASLARELALPYANLSLVVNWAAGKGNSSETVALPETVFEQGVSKILAVLTQLAK